MSYAKILLPLFKGIDTFNILFIIYIHLIWNKYGDYTEYVVYINSEIFHGSSAGIFPWRSAMSSWGFNNGLTILR